MSRYGPLFSLFAAFGAFLVPMSSAADDPSGYGIRSSAPSYDVSHSGYPSEAARPSSTTVEADTGDYVVIEQRDSAANHAIVVALIGNQEATLKRIEQKPGQVILHAANPAMSPMVYAPDEVQIQGVLVGLLRSYR